MKWDVQWTQKDFFFNAIVQTTTVYKYSFTIIHIFEFKCYLYRKDNKKSKAKQVIKNRFIMEHIMK